MTGIGDEYISRVATAKELYGVIAMTAASQNAEWVFRADFHFSEFPIWDIRGLSGHERDSLAVSFGNRSGLAKILRDALPA